MTKKETERVNEWSKANTKGYYIKLNKVKDSDLIGWMATINNKQGYLRSLIRSDIYTSKTDSFDYCLKLDREIDADIIRFLESQPDKNNFIKSLIRSIM